MRNIRIPQVFTLILHVCIYSDIEISRQKVSLMNRSLKMLKDGTYRA